MRHSILLLAFLAAAGPALAAPQAVGDLLQAPDGNYYLLDSNQGGGAASWQLRRTSWGRLVNVHAIDASGAVVADPVLRDLVIHPDVASDGVDYLLEENPITHVTRLVILRPFQGAGGASDPFVALLKKTQRNLPSIEPKGDALTTVPPYSMLPRNAALVLEMDDLLADGAAESLALASTVKTLVGYPPLAPYGVRALFDRNHGSVIGMPTGNEFHSTRIILDTTVSELEAGAMAVPAPVNMLGLPASAAGSTQANVAVRIPTTIAPAVGQFEVLHNLAGNPVSPGAGPFDATSPTGDVVRAFRSGNARDPFKGFLSDSTAPQLLGRWQATVEAAFDDPAGTAGLDFVLSLRFNSPCAAAPQPGHVVETTGRLLEVTAAGAEPDAGGFVPRVKVHAFGTTTAAALLGPTSYILPYQPGEEPACWLTVTPAPATLPATGVDPSAQVSLLFSEPMDPASVTPYDTFALTRAGHAPTAHEFVPAEVLASPDLTTYASAPALPLAHVQGSSETYHVWFGGPAAMTDLAGNPVVAKPKFADLALDAGAPTDVNGGVVMRFSAFDEIQLPAAAAGNPDLRGQVLFDLAEGVVKPRPVTRFSAAADRSQAVPGIMIPFAPGVQAPLNPLGAKLMSVWRYADVGMSATDEATHNVDVEGLAWAPFGGAVIADVFPEFEMRLSHSHYLPEEHLDQLTLLPQHPQSGLSKTTFDANVLADAASTQKVVHAKALGYAISPLDVFTSTSGTQMLPWPLNKQGGPYTTYLWRDTAIQAVAAPNGAGIDQKIMADAGLIPAGTAGSIAGANEVPSIGLPLLMEFRCYPSATSIGLNNLDVSLAINTSRLPAFRVYSAGGFGGGGLPVVKDPDLELVPSGGFNPASVPPGKATAPDDDLFYIGQMDLVTRVSRAHTIWIDTGVSDGSTTFLVPQILPAPADQPAGTEIIVALRGASAIGGTSGASGAGLAFDASAIDPYGAVRVTAGKYLGADSDVTFVVAGDATWKTDPLALAGARFVQARVTFVGNAQTLESAELSSLAFAYDHQ